MTGSLTQSYFVFDSQSHKVGRKIFYGMEGRDESDEDDYLEGIVGHHHHEDEEAHSSKGKGDHKSSGSHSKMAKPPPKPHPHK